jgi:thioredoxin reductase (NADPH)
MKLLIYLICALSCLSIGITLLASETATFNDEKKISTHWPLIIIGSGPAGLTASIYASRSEIPHLLFEGSEPGGHLMKAERIENWPGKKSDSGADLVMDMREHATSLGSNLIAESVTEINLSQRPFTIKTDAGNIFTADSVIIATGTQAKKLHVPNEEKFWGKGIALCSLCEGPFYKNKNVVIAGGGTVALKNAIFMTKYTDSITLIQNKDHLTAAEDMVKELEKHPEIKILYNHEIIGFDGDEQKMQSISLRNKLSNDRFMLKPDVVFLATGLVPNTKIFEGQLELNSKGQIICNNQVKSSVDGVFAAGNVTEGPYFQAIVCAAMGCMAEIEAEQYLSKKGLIKKGANSTYIN